MDGLLTHAGWIAAGLVSAGIAVILRSKTRALDAQVLGERPRTYARRRAKLQAEITSRAMYLPVAVMLFALAAVWPPPEVQRVSGKPVEMRSWSRLVVMPDGSQYTFVCGSRSSRCSRSDKESWDRLPRWPEPNHVEMLVSGHEINSLIMDGQLIVNRPPDDERFGFVMIGFGLLAYVMVSISLRAFKLRKIPLRARGRSRASPETP
ncbi:hypothetical protein EIB18_00170 [Caulobacter vibrioides]|uniref:Uncharacterized protein n=2 Tax=Caulobacter vibrioides TaxID=155892 RepID=Q9AC33_CAUVC|nr:hypothetical protein [Caulobacter vibrioides]YP_009020483.1 hypothetical protein CCNA_03912 [Caulobacter vibrioides NA1000]AAK22021.1 hypothetical protein CC_0033 [Caulobacter vibrioides CB15]AHI88514.1 hypothetical protein CCNA_03912 [Caulobacter vibrioides NA1000]ATC26870.1 hypothetical protein CA607_00165 [Caulobacter vibrioides]AZH11265.1 hypothetical protein EIB18_00170 [Caulobacter vibrioides]QXZ52129.1 hypothetical protein KZH45_00170 [Caulobacter vibrioides]